MSLKILEIYQVDGQDLTEAQLDQVCDLIQDTIKTSEFADKITTNPQ